MTRAAVLPRPACPAERRRATHRTSRGKATLGSVAAMQLVGQRLPHQCFADLIGRAFRLIGITATEILSCDSAQLDCEFTKTRDRSVIRTQVSPMLDVLGLRSAVRSMAEADSSTTTGVRRVSAIRILSIQKSVGSETIVLGS